MKKMRKILSFLVVVCMIASFVVGCGSTGSTNSSNSTAAAAAATVPADTAKSTSAAPISKEPVTISFIYWADGAQKALNEAAFKKFHELNPTITIDAQSSNAGAAGYIAKMQTLIASNSLPDCSYLGETEVQTYADQLYDLSDAFASGEIPKKLDNVTIKNPEGKTLAVGLSNQLMFIYYNKDLFDKEKVEYPPSTIEKAWDWAKFVQVAKQLTKDKNGKHPDDAGFDAKNTKTFGAHFAFLFDFSFMWALNSNGGGYFSPDGKELWLGKPETIEGFQKLADLFNKDHVAPTQGSTSTSQIPGVDQALLTNRVAMFIGGSWDLANAGKAKNESKLNYGIGVLPKLKTAITMNCGGPMVIYKTTKHPAEAKAFFKYMEDPAQMLPLLQSGAWLPNEEKWYTDPELVKQWIDSPNYPAEARDVILGYANTPGATVEWPAYFVPTYKRIVAPIITPALDDIWSGKKTPDEVIKGLLPKIEPIFADGKAVG